MYASKSNISPPIIPVHEPKSISTVVRRMRGGTVDVRTSNCNGDETLSLMSQFDREFLFKVYGSHSCFKFDDRHRGNTCACAGFVMTCRSSKQASTQAAALNREAPNSCSSGRRR
jgi:uncharacterized ParB-like nuclease family protein